MDAPFVADAIVTVNALEQPFGNGLKVGVAAIGPGGSLPPEGVPPLVQENIIARTTNSDILSLFIRPLSTTNPNTQ